MLKGIAMKDENKGFVLIRPTPNDFERVIRFMVACDVAEFGEPDTDEGDVADQWKEADLQKDAWLAKDSSGDLCGYAILNSAGDRGLTFDLYAQPGEEGLAVKRALIDQVIERATIMANRKTVLTTYVNGLNPTSRPLMESKGFKYHTVHYRMQIDFASPAEPVIWSPEYHLHAVRPEDEHELYELINAAFDWPGRGPVTFEDWKKHLFRDGRYDPGYFILVRQEGRLVAAALSYDEGSLGWVRQLAVAKDIQGKGLGSMLLRHVFAVFSQKGVPTVALGVESENEKAAHFYEAIGMHRSREFVEYHLEVG